MKIYKLILVAFLTMFLFSSCEKKTEGLSEVIYHASFRMAGDEFMFVILGSEFTDPGVRAFQREQELEVTVTGDEVDPDTPGVYFIKYSATNSDGYKRSVKRTVAVVNAIPTLNLAGEYQAVGRTNTMTVTPNMDGVIGYWHASNSWWQTYPIPLDFIDMGDGTLYILDGVSPYGTHGNYPGSKIEPDDQLRFRAILKTGGSAGATWNTVWKKIAD